MWRHSAVQITFIIAAVCRSEKSYTLPGVGLSKSALDEDVLRRQQRGRKESVNDDPEKVNNQDNLI